MKDLSDLRLERDFPVSVARLWQAITRPEEIVQWFGPEGVRLDRCEMDLRRTGPYLCVMIGKESGNRFVVSGQVTSVTPPESGSGSVALTWGWHDDQDRRGPESFVTFSVAATENGARLVLEHRDLTDAENMVNHERGWTSTLEKIAAYLG